MRTIFHDRTKMILSCAFIVIFGLSLIGSPYPEYLFLQHIPTLIAFIVVPMWDRRWPLSPGAFACLLAMLVLHVIGARYTYSFVPYDTWCQTVSGYRLSEVFDLERNHYDRLVHFLFGLLLVYPMQEILLRKSGITTAWSYFIAVNCITAFSAVYEILEAIAALIVSPELGAAYLGTQGDEWDAQKDSLLAFGGAVIAMFISWHYTRRNAAPA